jgi:hypothetical protein
MFVLLNSVFHCSNHKLTCSKFLLTTGRIELSKDGDAVAAPATIRDACPSIEAFKRNFSLLRFALATGVERARFEDYLARY